MIDLETIKRAYEAQGKTQEELGKQLGITQPNAGKLLAGKRQLKVHEAQKLATWLGIQDGEVAITLPSELILAEVVRSVVRAAAPERDISGPVAEVYAKALLNWLRILAADPRASIDPEAAHRSWVDAVQQAFLQKLEPQVA